MTPEILNLAPNMEFRHDHDNIAFIIRIHLKHLEAVENTRIQQRLENVPNTYFVVEPH